MLEMFKLEQFVVLAHHRSYTTAAAALHVSQPTLTRTIQGLERTVQAKLFDRGRNGVALTDIGTDLLRHAEDLLRHAGSVEADIAARSHGIRGHVRIGAGPMIGGSIMPGVVQSVIESGHDISLRILLLQAHTMYSMMLDGELDFFISRAPNPGWSDRLTSKVLGYARTEFWVRPTHPLARKKRVTFEDLGRFQRVTGTAWNELLPSRVSADLAKLISATIEIDDSGVLYKLVEQTDTILISSWDPGLEELVPLHVVKSATLLVPQPVMLNSPVHRTLSPAVLYVMKIAERSAARFMPSEDGQPQDTAAVRDDALEEHGSDG